jgi:SM-20-related protein
MSAQSIAELLARDGLCVVPGFLPLESVRALRADLAALQVSGELKRAGVGQAGDKVIRDDVRRDEIHWLTAPGANPAQAELLARVAELRLALNRQLFLGLQDFEGHYALYPPGGFYQRHRDSFRRDEARVVSLILYLNEAWAPADGGQLRIYRADGSHLDVDPVGGTLVCFLSRETEHEVLESRRPRASFAGWFKQQAISGGIAPLGR